MKPGRFYDFDIKFTKCSTAGNADFNCCRWSNTSTSFRFNCRSSSRISISFSFSTTNFSRISIILSFCSIPFVINRLCSSCVRLQLLCRCRFGDGSPLDSFFSAKISTISLIDWFSVVYDSLSVQWPNDSTVFSEIISAVFGDGWPLERAWERTEIFIELCGSHKLKAKCCQACSGDYLEIAFCADYVDYSSIGSGIRLKIFHKGHNSHLDGCQSSDLVQLLRILLGF